MVPYLGVVIHFGFSTGVLDLKPTPSGYWVQKWYYGGRSDAPPSSQDAPGCVLTVWMTLEKPKWVSKTSVKCHAHPTEDEAWYALQRRAKRRVELFEMQMLSAKAVKCFADQPRPQES